MLSFSFREIPLIPALNFLCLCAVQGVCADQAKVCGYHRFQQVALKEGVVGELKLLFETRAELLHQTLSLHAYTAMLSRLQVESYLYRLLNANPTTRSVAVQESNMGETQCNSDYTLNQECGCTGV